MESELPVGRPVEWTPPERIAPVLVAGRTVAIRPLMVDDAEAMWEALGPNAAQWTYMGPEAPSNVGGMRRIIAGYLKTPDWIPHAITDPAGDVLGMASYLRVQPNLGSVEIGAISYGTRLRRSTAATEAMSLFARHAFATGYRRYEWKCDSLNAASRAAALRLGFRFEGVWRNAMIYKGRNRDTAWFAMTDDDWARLAPVHTAWLASAAEGAPAFRLSDAVSALWETRGS